MEDAEAEAEADKEKSDEALGLSRDVAVSESDAADRSKRTALKEAKKQWDGVASAPPPSDCLMPTQERACAAPSSRPTRSPCASPCARSCSCLPTAPPEAANPGAACSRRGPAEGARSRWRRSEGNARPPLRL